MLFDHGTIAPSAIDLVRSGITFHSSISIFSPSPVHAGQAPNGELNENRRGSSSWNEIPHDAQANDSLKVASVHTSAALAVPPFDGLRMTGSGDWYRTV